MTAPATGDLSSGTPTDLPVLARPRKIHGRVIDTHKESC